MEKLALVFFSRRAKKINAHLMREDGNRTRAKRRGKTKRPRGLYRRERESAKVGTPNLRALLNQRNATYRSRRSPVVMAA